MFRAIYFALRLRLLNFIDVQIIANFGPENEQNDQNADDELRDEQPDDDAISISSQSTGSGDQNHVLAIDEWEDNDEFLQNYTQVSSKL